MGGEEGGGGGGGVEAESSHGDVVTWRGRGGCCGPRREARRDEASDEALGF